MKWTKEHMIVAFALYCVLPFSEMNLKNKELVRIAEFIGHSASSLIMCMRNFKSLDVNQGLNHTGKLHQQTFEEFRNDFGALSLKAEQITGLDLFNGENLRGAKRVSASSDRKRSNRERHFFRMSVISNFESTCCISGCKEPKLLIASHIKPFTKCRSEQERIGPQNGLCLNALYDKAFDAGLMTITPDMKIHISPKLKGEFAEKWFYPYERIASPSKFQISKEFLEYHNDVVFMKEVI